MKIFKTAILGNYWKFKKVPWQIVITDKGTHIFPVDSVSLSIESGTSRERMTATRIITGGVLLGPVGAALGAMATKDTTEHNLVLEVPGDTFKIAFKSKELKDAQKFIEEVVKRQAR